jgi:hypothetical protein
LAVCSSLRAEPLTAEQLETPEEKASWDKATATVTEFQKTHPLRSSPILDSAKGIVRLLGRGEASAGASCSIDPNFPEWNSAASSLHENARLALEQSFEEGQQAFRVQFPPAQAMLFRDSDLCISEMDQVFGTLKELPSVFESLQSHGY